MQERVSADRMSEASAQRSALGALDKTGLRAAVDAIDDWVDANTASFNQAIPLPARTALTAKQKSWLLFMVVRRRFEEV